MNKKSAHQSNHKKYFLTTISIFIPLCLLAMPTLAADREEDTDKQTSAYPYPSPQAQLETLLDKIEQEKQAKQQRQAHLHIQQQNCDLARSKYQTFSQHNRIQITEGNTKRTLTPKEHAVRQAELYQDIEHYCQ